MREETDYDYRGQTQGISKYYDEEATPKAISGREILHLITRTWNFNAHRALGDRSEKSEKSGNRFCRTAEKRETRPKSHVADYYNSSASRVCEFPDDVILFLGAETSVGKKTRRPFIIDTPGAKNK